MKRKRVMRYQRVLPKEVIERVIRLFNAGEKQEYIRSVANISLWTFYKIIDEAGLPRRHKSMQERDAVIMAQFAMWMPYKKIAEYHRISYDAVLAVAKRAVFTKHDALQSRNKLIGVAYAEGSSVETISNEFDISTIRVRQVLREQGVPLRRVPEVIYDAQSTKELHTP